MTSFTFLKDLEVDVDEFDSSDTTPPKKTEPGNGMTFIPVPIAIADWLSKRGKAVRPEMTTSQRAELKECFNLIDADGSGAIGADEMTEAFQFMDIKVSPKELAEIIAEVDRDGSGEIEYPEFVEIMTSSLETISKRKAKTAGGDEASDEMVLPFPLLATAYRRKQLISAMFGTDVQARTRIIDQATKASEEAAALKREMKEAMQRSKEQGERPTPGSHPRPSATFLAGRLPKWKYQAAQNRRPHDFLTKHRRYADLDPAYAQRRAGNVPAAPAVRRSMLVAPQRPKLPPGYSPPVIAEYDDAGELDWRLTSRSGPSNPPPSSRDTTGKSGYNFPSIPSSVSTPTREPTTSYSTHFQPQVHISVDDSYKKEARHLMCIEIPAIVQTRTYDFHKSTSHAKGHQGRSWGGGGSSSAKSSSGHNFVGRAQPDSSRKPRQSVPSLLSPRASLYTEAASAASDYLKWESPLNLPKATDEWHPRCLTGSLYSPRRVAHTAPHRLELGGRGLTGTMTPPPSRPKFNISAPDVDLK